ncbi:MAG TPA: coproporphyrinogen-III oxidase family protein, partial [Blastocatellia bacterium]|nr:coproporphyrinogen-III oxidase family protein [Blastocatellia bacterium]
DEYMSFLDSGPSDKGLMVYIHIPFCEALCYFCNYYKVVIKKDSYNERRDLFAAYKREIENYASRRYFEGRPIRAIQFGGGTPSAVEPEFIVELIDCVRKNFKSDFELVSMEGNVTSIQDPAQLQVLKDGGVQRISFGVQTFNEQIRKKLHLKATVEDVYKAVEALNKVGFDDYSHDLMFNLPDQTVEDVRADIETADREIRPTYIDCYNLNVMPNTMFDAALGRETYCTSKPSDQMEIVMMREVMNITKPLGYNQVMSNVFSKKKDRCVLTLEMELDGSDIIGIGPSARGFLMGHGYRNIASLEEYADRVYRDRYPIVAGNVTTREEDDERRMVMFGNFTYLKKSTVADYGRFSPQVEFLIREGYAVDDGEYLRLTDEGKVWPGNVSELFFNGKQRLRRNVSMLSAFKNKENPYNQDRMGVSAALYQVKKMTPQQKNNSPENATR